MKIAFSDALTRLRNRYHPLWRLRRSGVFLWFQRRFDVAVGRQVGRVRVYSYLLRDLSQFLPHNRMEQKTTEVFRQVLVRGGFDLMVDVGANIGNFSWLVASVAPTTRLLLFEPDARNIALLKKTLHRSALPNARLEAVALSSQSGRAGFIVDEASGAVGSLVDQRGASGGYNLHDSYRLRKVVDVPTRRLDDYLPSLEGSRILMKVDVEGAEHLVFEGAADVLVRLRPVIFCESFHIWKLQSLRNRGYRVFSLEEDANYVAVPEERLSLIADLGLRDVSPDVDRACQGSIQN